MDKSVFYKHGPFQLVGAHRGGSHERAENTMPAFENAVAQGCNLLELDISRTRDDQILAMTKTLEGWQVAKGAKSATLTMQTSLLCLT